MKANALRSTASLPTIAVDESRVAVWLKWTCTALLMVLVPVCWANYGPTNFICFRDTALFLALFAPACLPTHLALTKLTASRSTRQSS